MMQHTLASRIIDQGRLIFFSQKCGMVGPYLHMVDYFNLAKIYYGRLLAHGRLMDLVLFFLLLSLPHKNYYCKSTNARGKYWKIHLVEILLVNPMTFLTVS